MKTAKERPLLGRYVLVEAEPTVRAMAAVRAVGGVESIISNQDKPPVFPTDWVISFRERYLSGEWDFVRTDNPCPFYDKNGVLGWRLNEAIPIGARIKIIEGEFAEMLATVTGTSGRKVTFKVLNSTDFKTVNQRSVRAARPRPVRSSLWKNRPSNWCARILSARRSRPPQLELKSSTGTRYA